MRNEQMSAQFADQYFDRYGEYWVPLRFYECDSHPSLELLYQVFKARLMAELAEEAPLELKEKK